MIEALFGGSFNPIYIGHLITAQGILNSFDIDRIIFVPANIQPLKGKLMIPAHIKLKLSYRRC